jgi:hypothetical protein
MLEKDPNKRATCEDLKKDAWLNTDRIDLSIEV